MVCDGSLPAGYLLRLRTLRLCKKRLLTSDCEGEMKNFAAPRGLGRESVGMTVVSTVPDFFTVEEAAAILRIGRTAAYALAREYLATDGASGLPVVRLGKLLRVPRTRLVAMTGTDPVSGVVSSLSSTTAYDNLLDTRVSTPAPAGAQQTVNSSRTDWDGNLNSVIEPQTTGPNGAVADRITSYTYDVNGSVVSIVDPKGFTTSFTNDVYGRRVNSSDPDKGNTATYYNVD
jgi:YD repeat-containing protein